MPFEKGELNKLTLSLALTDSVGDKQVLCLRPTVPGVASLSSVIVSNILGIIFFGGAAQTGGVGKCAAVVPEPPRPVLGTVPGPAPILVLVPGQEHAVIMLLYSDLNLGKLSFTF